MNTASRNILLFLLSVFLSLGILTVGLLGYRFVSGQPLLPESGTSMEVLGESTILSPIAGVVSKPAAVVSRSVRSTAPAAPGTTGVPAKPTPVPEPSVRFVNLPSEITAGDAITFTWHVDGPPQTIRTTTVYYGTTSTPGTLNRAVSPDSTAYDMTLPDFLDGSYSIPLQFIGNARITTPGVHYARVYALINGRHYWSPEVAFTVVPRPVSTIRVVNYTQTVKVGENASFTWEVSGPQTTTGFTAIVGGTASDPGSLGENITIPQTPYAVMVPDFTTGSYQVPLRFVGNTAFTSSGVYYFRALAFIDGRNVWSDEYSVTVQ